MQPVTDVQTMRASDAETIRRVTSGKELMYRAGAGVYKSYQWQGPVAIVCGSGNNAGDGYVLASLLHENGISCTLFLLSDRFSSDGAYYYQKCCELGIRAERYTPNTDLSPYAEIVDCIFGTGFRGNAEGLAADAIEKINQSGKVVISVDINSGLDGENGLSPLCVISDLTVSLGFYKNGHFLNRAKDVIGKLINVDIGIELFGECCYLTEAEDFRSVLKPRPQDSHKGNYGYVSILGGCSAYSGAVKLANMSCAALRAGCGVAQLIIPASLTNSVSPYLLESTLVLLPDEDGHMRFDPELIDCMLARQAALAIGMGWGRSLENAKILEYILRNYSIPVVIDADGLNTLAEMDKRILWETKCKVLLTPHLKEMGRLSGIPLEEIRRDPIGVSQKFATAYGVCVLLKGPCSVVTDGNNTYLVDRGCAGMATAGSGDVLSGILVGLLGHAPFSALTAACGAYIAGRAGELAERDSNPISMLASDTVAHIPQAVSEML